MYQKQIDAFLAAWNEGIFDGMDESVAEGITRRVPNPLDDNSTNRTEVKQVITKFRTAYPDLHITTDQVVFHESGWAMRWTFTGTNTGPGDHPATGNSVNISGTSFVRCEDGKMAEEIFTFDALEFFMQLGIIEMPEAAASA